MVTFGYINNLGRVPCKGSFTRCSDSAKATVLEVSEGSESTGIDISIGRPVESFSASGRVIEGEKGTTRREQTVGNAATGGRCR